MRTYKKAKTFQRMTRIFSLFIFLFLVNIAQAATPWLKRPLRYVCADSVITWGYDGKDFRRFALMADSTATAYPMILTRKVWNERKAIFEKWNVQVAERNVVGGTGDPLTESQGLAALKWIDQAANLFQMQGDATYADYIERALYNAILHTAHDTLLPRGSIDRKAAASLLLSAPGLIYATQANTDLYVNLYTNCTSRIKWGDGCISVDQITDMPMTGSVKLRFTQLGGGKRITLHLRMPDWAGLRSSIHYAYVGGEPQQPTIYVNGHEFDPLEVDDKGYVTIDRLWRNLDEVYIDFPLQAYYVKPISPPTAQRLAPIYGETFLQWGPLVYAVKASASDYFVPSQPALPDNAISPSGYPVLQGRYFHGKDVPQDAEASSVTFRVMPFGDQ